MIQSQPDNPQAAHVQSMLREALAAGNERAMLEAGAAALRIGLFTDAVGPVRQSLRSHPENARLWQLLGLLERNLDDSVGALEAFRNAARLAPDDPMIANGHASAAFEAGLPAADLLDRAFRLNPTDRSILLRKASAQFSEGRSDAATSGLQQELSTTPGWTEGHTAAARLRWSRGEREHFADSYEQALLAAPRDVALWRGYIETLLNAQLFERALPLIARARSAAGSHPTFDAAEAIAKSELGEPDAEEAFRRVAHVKSVAITLYHLRFLLRAGRVAEAGQIAEAGAPRDPSNQIWPYLSIAWRLLGDARWQWLEGDPRFIGVYDLSPKLQPIAALAQRLRALHRATDQPPDQSLRGGTQTEGHLFPRIEPEIRQLRQAVVEAVEQHVAQLPPPQPNHPLLVQRRGPIRFAGSWSVRLTDGGRHIEHVHPAGWISSALYVALPGEQQRGHGEAGWLALGQVSDLGIDLPPIRLIEPKPGLLVLFPSTMWHSTRPFEAGERLTVAFDVKRPS